MEGTFSKQKIEIFFFGNLKANTFPKVKHLVENIHFGINFPTAFFQSASRPVFKMYLNPFHMLFFSKPNLKKYPAAGRLQMFVPPGT